MLNFPLIVYTLIHSLTFLPQLIFICLTNSYLSFTMIFIHREAEKMKKLFLTIFLMAGLGFSLYAQHTLKVIIRGGKDKIPLAGATLTWKEKTGPW